MMEVDETVEELAVKFAENCGWVSKNQIKIKNSEIKVVKSQLFA